VVPASCRVDEAVLAVPWTFVVELTRSEMVVISVVEEAKNGCNAHSAPTSRPVSPDRLSLKSSKKTSELSSSSTSSTATPGEGRTSKSTVMFTEADSAPGLASPSRGKALAPKVLLDLADTAHGLPTTTSPHPMSRPAASTTACLNRSSSARNSSYDPKPDTTTDAAIPEQRSVASGEVTGAVELAWVPYAALDASLDVGVGVCILILVVISSYVLVVSETADVDFRGASMTVEAGGSPFRYDPEPEPENAASEVYGSK